MMTPTFQLNSRGGLYDPVMKTRNMWSQNGDDHRVRAPPMHLTHDAERNMFAQAHDVRIGVLQRGSVVEHQQQSGEGQLQEQEKAQSAHTPGVAEPHPGLPEPNRVHVQKHVRQHDQDSVPIVDRRIVPKNRCPDLCLGQPIPSAHETPGPSGRWFSYQPWSVISGERIPSRSTGPAPLETCGSCRSESARLRPVRCAPAPADAAPALRNLSRMGGIRCRDMGI